MSIYPLARALEQAVGGRRAPLFDLLERGSRLPGPRMNASLSDAFAQACRALGVEADPVALVMARLSAGEAPGATAREFLPVCGVLALASRAAADESVRAHFIAELHARADDTRFRVRDAVAEGLSRVGGVAGDALARDVAGWTDGYFHAAAVARALGRAPWVGSLRDPAPSLSRLGEAFALLDGAPRAAARWPGYKELSDALGATAAVIARRFGAPAFDMLVGWAAAGDPDLRALVAGVLGSRELVGRFGLEVARVRRALDVSRPPVRNPDHDVGPTRDRGRRRRA